MKINTIFIGLCICGLLFSIESSISQNKGKWELIDKNATPETKALFRNLKKIADNGRFLFGQQDATASGYGWNDDSGRSDIQAVTGHYPAFFTKGRLELSQIKIICERPGENVLLIRIFIRNDPLSDPLWDFIQKCLQEM